MNFNSPEYILFFLLVLIGSWFMARKPQLRFLFLLLASYYFYASNNGYLLLLIVGSTLVDYMAGLAIEKSERKTTKRSWLIASLVVNLGVLAFFKYTNFLVQSLNTAAQALDYGVSFPLYEIALPVGISFYTFQSMSYTIDVYRGQLKAEKSLLRFSFFVAFFPQLVAGPIVRARYFLHQLDHPPRLGAKGLEAALYLIFFGLFKKIVLADTLGIYADQAFNAPESAHAITAWLGLYAFAFQIYFDFSGYTDIAIGCAGLLGFRLPPNFKRPYTARSFTEFWRRWHISLSFWLRDYLYKPLGGNRKGHIRTYINLMITMLLGGLWHGASWTFLLWGFLHGLFLALERLFGLVRLRHNTRDEKLWQRFLYSMLIFHLVVIAWLPFRAAGWGNLMDMMDALTRVNTGVTITLGMVMAGCIIIGGLGSQWLGETLSFKRYFLRLPVFAKAFIYAGLACLIVVFSARGTQPFVYFQF